MEGSRKKKSAGQRGGRGKKGLNKYLSITSKSAGRIEYSKDISPIGSFFFPLYFYFFLNVICLCCCLLTFLSFAVCPVMALWDFCFPSFSSVVNDLHNLSVKEERKKKSQR